MRGIASLWLTFLVNNTCEVAFSGLVQVILSRIVSNHFPISLVSSPPDLVVFYPIFFENMWLTHAHFKEMVGAVE